MTACELLRAGWPGVSIENSEAALREIVARLQGMETRLQGMDDKVAETRSDAREARDAAMKLTERVGTQDMPAKLAELRGEVEKGFQAARSDLVNAVDKLTREVRSDFDNLNGRVKALEDFRLRIEGAGGLVGWLGKNASWLLSLFFAGLAVLGFKDKIP